MVSARCFSLFCRAARAHSKPPNPPGPRTTDRPPSPTPPPTHPPPSVVLCFIALGYLIGYGKENVKEALSFTVVLLVASIPIAIEIVCTTTLALGSRTLSQEGAIVTRLASIEEMAGMNMLCSDKTGTLTLNKMVIQEDCPIYTPGEPLRFAFRWLIALCFAACIPAAAFAPTA